MTANEEFAAEVTRLYQHEEKLNEDHQAVKQHLESVVSDLEEKLVDGERRWEEERGRREGAGRREDAEGWWEEEGRSKEEGGRRKEGRDWRHGFL